MGNVKGFEDGLRFEGSIDQELNYQMKSKLQYFCHLFLLTVVTTAVLGLLTGCGQSGDIIELGKKKSNSLAPTLVPTVQQPEDRSQGSVENKTLHINVKETNQADVVIVVDNSASMRFEQANMAQRFSSLLDEMKRLDWRLGIITTDVSKDEPRKDGRFLNMKGTKGLEYLSSEMSDDLVKSAFSGTIQRPSREGNSNEQGIKATVRALERKPEWLRDQASLNVVVVTDADETPVRGKAEPRNNPSYLLSLVKKNNPQKSFIFHSIIVKEGDEACLKKDDNEGYGRTYAWLSQKTGGIIGDVCSQDYSKQLNMIGQQVSQKIKNFQLECSPLPGSVVIQPEEGAPITGFQLKGSEVLLDEALPPGTTRVDYQCLR